MISVWVGPCPPLVRKLSGDETSESESSSRLSVHLGSAESLWAATLVMMPEGRCLGNSFFSHSRSDVLPRNDMFEAQKMRHRKKLFWNAKKKNKRISTRKRFEKRFENDRNSLRVPAVGAIILKQLKCSCVSKALLYARMGPLRIASLASRFGHRSAKWKSHTRVQLGARWQNY